jgi:UDP-N-acetylglucosamine acyltransferase
MLQSFVSIHPDAKIGENVQIESFTTIYKDVEIGEGTWVGPNVTIMSGARIGKNCKIYPGAVIAGTPQDLKFQGEESLAIIGDNTVIRECVTVNRGTSESGKTIIGKNCLIMAYVHVAHDCVIGDNCILVNAVQLAGHVEMGDFAIIGGMSAVHQFVKIGAHVMISGGSLVRKDVPSYVKAAHEPLSFVGVNSLGLRRRGFSTPKIEEIKEIYRYIYQRGMNNSDALNAVEAELPACQERDLITAFVRASKRGVIRSGLEHTNSDEHF